MNAEILSDRSRSGNLARDFDRLVLEIVDVPTTCATIRRLVELLGGLRHHSFGLDWESIKATLREHDIGRLLRSDPMTRRCQWRPADADAYDIVEAFAMSWDDAPDSLLEAEPPGQTVNTVFLNMGLAAAIRERRNMVHPYFAALPPDAAVLGLGAGRAPEIELLEPTGVLDHLRWVSVDAVLSEKPYPGRRSSTRVEWRRLPLLDFVAASAGVESFDLIYLVDALDGIDDLQAVALLQGAVGLLRPNGKLILSSFVPDMPEAAYLDAALDWRPNLRGEAELNALFAAVRGDGRLAQTSWRGGTDRIAFSLVERLSWAA